jgi:prolyl-tRNA editing enzyme YbaK/EbsC (Cys-tRNA(Pro) deacylase)
MKSALDVHRELLAGGVAHEIVRLRTPILSADELPEALAVPTASCVAVRCYVTTSRDGTTAMVAVLVRAGDTPHPTSLLAALDASAVRRAEAGEINAATDYAAGLVSPLCLPRDVTLLADAALGRDLDPSGVVYAPAGENGVALAVHLRDLLLAARAQVTSLTAQPLSAVDRLGWNGLADPAEEEGEGAVASVRLLPGRGPRRTG